MYMYLVGQNPLLVHSPLLSHLLWWRIVADEAHQLLKSLLSHLLVFTVSRSEPAAGSLAAAEPPACVHCL